MPAVWDIIPFDLAGQADIVRGFDITTKERINNFVCFQKVGICDSGFMFDHPDLDGSKVVWQRDYVENNHANKL